MNVQEKASRAKRLRDDEAFQDLMAEVRNDAIAAFVNSGAADAAAREEAHALLRALSKIEGTLEAAIGAKTLADKKGQHRGSD